MSERNNGRVSNEGLSDERYRRAYRANVLGIVDTRGSYFTYAFLDSHESADHRVIRQGDRRTSNR